MNDEPRHFGVWASMIGRAIALVLLSIGAGAFYGVLACARAAGQGIGA